MPELILLLPAVALPPLVAALALLIHQRRRPQQCQHSGWLDLPAPSGLGPPVHERMVQAFRELERQRDAAQAECTWNEDAARVLGEELRACEDKLIASEMRSDGAWEAIDELERDVAVERDARATIREWYASHGFDEMM